MGGQARSGIGDGQKGARMCGFAGQIGSQPEVSRQTLYRMNNALLHRGPDESGLRLDERSRWGVGNRRLCVIDLEGGKQPMVDAARGLTLVYNGEIYDHDRLRAQLSQRGYSFRTQSDTEVLLALYALDGVGCFEQLRGEFAFAIVDERQRVAILGRDRMGLKPLFYTRTADSFYFASEIKALLRVPGVRRELDPTGLTGALAIADTPGNTVFRDIHQVRHAHYLRVNLDTLEASEHCYWDAFAQRRRDVPSTFADQVDWIRQEINQAIQLRLRADVPVGAYLSGGLDSSLVTGVMAQNLEKLDAFGLAFEDSPRHNEFPYAEEVASLYPNVCLHRIPVTYPEMVRRLPETVWHLERPFGNLHSVAKLMAAQYARDHVVCVLTGDGGDEAFCGYSTHWLQNELQQVNYSLSAIRGKLAAMKREARAIGGNRYYLAGGLARRIGPETQFLADKLGFRPCDLATAVDAERRVLLLMNPDFRQRMEQSPVERLVDDLAPRMPPPDAMPHAALLQYVQLNTSVPEYIATIADRSEAAGSVEARPPLFDHQVIAAALALPLEAKLRGDREKHILREAFRDSLPQGVIERRKQAFLAPPAPFSSPFGRALLERYLSPRAVREAGIWQPWKISALLAARRIMPRSRLVNLVLTVVLTAQILHDQFILGRPWR